MSPFVIREAQDDFAAFKIGEAALKSGGDIVAVTVSPVCVFDHVHGYARVSPEGRLRWIVWMTFGADFDVDVLDAAIAAEDEPKP